MDEVLERTQGRSGELVLRRSRGHLEVILNGAFLISTENDASSRAMVAAALPHLAGDALEVLIGGLGLGYALDEALAEPACRARHGGRAGADHRALVPRARGRARGSAPPQPSAPGARASSAPTWPRCSRRDAGRYDLVSLDTDNGPEWLVRDDNAGLYDEDGVRLVAAALRPGGVAVFWSPDRYPAFEDVLARVFARVRAPRPPSTSCRAGATSTPCTWAWPRRGRLATQCDGTRRLRGSHLETSPSEIAWALIDAYPEADPLDLNFVDLHRMIVELDDFDDDPEEASETILEAVVVAWNDQR